MLLVAGDIGGTKTLLSLYEKTGNQFDPLHSRRFNSGEYPTFDLVISEFIKEIDSNNISALCLGIAGPVTQQDNKYIAQATNLPWKIDSYVLSQATGISNIALINDFAAMGFGVSVMQEADLLTLQRGQPQQNTNRIVLGAGTGLGIAQLISVDNQFSIVASEGGHANFAPFDQTSAQLSQYFIDKIGYCSIEHVLSGPGITNIFEFITQHQGFDTSLDTHAEPATIANAYQSDEAARNTMDLFASIYGSVAGNLALTNLAFDGIYLTGGVAAKNSELLTKTPFIEAFHHKGKMSHLMPQFPIHIVTNEQCGLLGAAVAASRLQT